MIKHRKTDPACQHHRIPITPLGWWWFNRGRGKSCTPCVREWRSPLWTCNCGWTNTRSDTTCQRCGSTPPLGYIYRGTA